MELDRFYGCPHAQLGREQLGHGGLFLEWLPVLFEPSGVIHQMTRGLDLGGHVGQLEMDALKCRYGLAKLLAF